MGLSCPAREELSLQAGLQAEYFFSFVQLRTCASTQTATDSFQPERVFMEAEPVRNGRQARLTHALPYGIGHAAGRAALTGCCPDMAVQSAKAVQLPVPMFWPLPPEKSSHQLGM